MEGFKPRNNNVLVAPSRDIQKSAFQEADNRRDLQYGKVVATSNVQLLPNEEILEGDTIVYNPRNVTQIEFKGDVYVVIHELNIIAIL